jgi:cation:H+ antiporter
MLVLGIDPEESIASIIAALNGLPYISMGNIIGNSIIAMTLPFSIALLARPIKMHSFSPFYIILLFILLATIFLGLILNIFLVFSGIIALLFYIIYFVRNIKQYSSKNHEKDQSINLMLEVDANEVELPPEVSKFKKIGFVITGIILIFFGGEILIYSAERILEIIPISETFFGFIVVGFVTNVEELTLIVKSIKKQVIEIGIGGMIGKLIWNLTITYGISSIIIMSIPFNAMLIWNLFILVLIFICYSIFFRKELLKRSQGLVLLLIFILFVSLNFFALQL